VISAPGKAGEGGGYPLEACASGALTTCYDTLGGRTSGALYHLHQLAPAGATLRQ